MEIKSIIEDGEIGGEPLLYFNKAIYPFSKLLKEWAGANKILFTNIMTTNGGLINEYTACRMNETESSFINEKCLGCEVLPSCMNDNLCIQKIFENGQTECKKEEIKKAIRMYVRNKISKSSHAIKSFIFLLITLTGFCNMAYSQEENDTTISYSKELDEVTVMASYTDRKKNGDIVVNIQNNPIARGKTTVEMLNYIQGVRANDGDISILGRSGTIIYLDNRIISIDELKTISPDMIAKVIINPYAPTRHGANALGGVIRIELKKIWGVMGTVALRNQYDLDGFIDIYPHSSVLYRKGKHSVFSNIHTGYVDERHSNESTYLYQNGTAKNYHTKDTTRMPFLNGNIGYIYNFTEDDYISAYGGISLSRTRNYYQSDSEDDVLGIDSKNKNINYRGAIEYKKFFNKKYKNYFNIKAEYRGDKNNQDATYILGRQDNTTTASLSNSYTVIPEILLNIKGNQTLNSGVNICYAKDKIDCDGINNALLEQIITQKYITKGTYIYSWLEYSKYWGRSLYMRLGLTQFYGEHKYKDHINAANSNIITDKGLYPNVMFNWWPDKQQKTSLSFEYRHYYSQPNYEFYNPVVIYISDNMYSTGNTWLKQETFDRFEMNYNINSHWAFTYRLTLGHDIIRIISHYDDNKGMYYTMPENAGNSWRHDISAYWNGYITKKLYSNNTLTYTYVKEKMPGQKVSRPFVYFLSNNQYNLSQNAGITLELYAISKMENLNYTQDWQYSVSPGVYVTLLKKKLSLNLAVSNLFHNQFGKITIKRDGYEIKRTNNTRVSWLKLTATWNFKAGKDIKDVKRNSVSINERKKPVL